MPTKVRGDEFFATEAEAIRGALNQHADLLDSLGFEGIPASGTRPAFATAREAITWLLSQPAFSELVVPQAVQAGSLYLTSTGIWAPRYSFTANAAPTAGPNWRLVAGFAGQASSLPASGITDATEAGRRMLTAANAAAQRALVNNPDIAAGAYGDHPRFVSTDDASTGLYAWLIRNVVALLASAPVVQPGAAPIVTGFLPSKGSEGASITITGSRFVDITSVSFNGTPASFQAVNATTIQAVVPTGATTGPVSVSNESGTGTSAANFTVGVTTTPPPAGDTTAPNISLTVPTAGATLTVGQPVTLTATATDNVAVTSVVFTNGATGAPLGSGAKNGNSYTLAYTPTASGSLTITATATDAAGNSQAASVTVNVQAAVNQPPSVTINGSSTATVGTNQNYQSVASDSDGSIALVELLLMADASTLTSFSVIGSDDSSPYVVGWQPSAAGTAYLRMRATDDKGAQSFSSALAVTVQTSGPDFSASVNNQRSAALVLPSGATTSEYEYQFRPAPTVSAARQVDLTAMLGDGETYADYEYQFRPA